MRLADRLFAFWRFPAWTDVVQVLLWSLGWGLWVVFGVFLALAVRTAMLGYPFWAMGTFGYLVLLVIVMSFGWMVAGCWFVSEAYRGWRAGHPHGKQWTVLIAILCLTGIFRLVDVDRLDRLQALQLAVQVSFGLALLVAALTTRPPAAPQVAPA